MHLTLSLMDFTYVMHQTVIEEFPNEGNYIYKIWKLTIYSINSKLFMTWRWSL